jgi:hypothetical protein
MLQLTHANNANIPPSTTFTNLTSKGAVAADFANRLQGAEANLVWNLAPPASGGGFQFLLLGGFRYLDFNEQLDLAGSTSQTGTALTLSSIGPERIIGPTIAGNSVSVMAVNDHFDTRNQFCGGQFGGEGRLIFGRLFLDITGKLALGSTREDVTISGTHFGSFTGTTMLAVQGPNIPPSTFQFQQVAPGGVFAQPSNIGHYSRNVFAAVPEVNLNIGWQITSRLQASVGYNFLYWSNVARVGNSIDRTVSPAPALAFPLLQTTSGAASSPATLSRPSFAFHDTDFWAQGLTFTLMFSY